MITVESMEKITNVLGIDHVGYAVKDINHAKEKFKVLGYQFSESKVDDLRRVNVSIGRVGAFKIELISPIEIVSPVGGYLSKVGSTPYHICYSVNDIDESISKLCSQGFTQLGKPDLSVPLSGIVCFLYSLDIGLIELIEYHEEV